MMYLPAIRQTLWIILLLSVFLGGCWSPRPKKQSQRPKCTSNICSVIQANPDWYQHTEKAARQWGTSTPVIMAIIQKESGFRHDARPVKPQKKSKNGKKSKPQYLSSAYGYAQALNGTWDHYRRDTGRHRARRDNFADCVQFIGWYNAQSHKKCRIKKNDAYNLYLAYHEGHGGFNKKTHKKKKGIVSYARRVESQAKLYDTQLKQCSGNKLRTLAKNASVKPTGKPMKKGGSVAVDNKLASRGIKKKELALSMLSQEKIPINNQLKSTRFEGVKVKNSSAVKVKGKQNKLQPAAFPTKKQLIYSEKKGRTSSYKDRVKNSAPQK